jgi:hypothetical protein
MCRYGVPVDFVCRAEVLNANDFLNTADVVAARTLIPVLFTHPNIEWPQK